MSLLHSYKSVFALLMLLLMIILVSIVAYWVFQHQHGSVTASSIPRLSSRNCGDFFFDDFFHGRYEVQCFYYKTHEEGGFKLPVALIKQYDQDITDAEPIERELMVYIPGGPGQGYMTTADEITYWVDWLYTNEQTYDLLLFDPRGTGESIPSATCDSYNASAESLLAEAVETERELLKMNMVLSECLEAYAKVLKQQFPSYNGAELYDVFATRNQAEDIHGMATSLGYQRAHLWGVSYGTRLALAASQFDVVKTLILDSLYPFDKGLSSDWIELYQNSFNLHHTLYADFLKAGGTRISEARTERYKDLYGRVLARLQEKPLKISLQRWRDERIIDFTLTPERLLELSFSHLYSPHRYGEFYRGLAYLAEMGDVNAELLAVLEYFVNNVLDENFSFIAYYAVECLDNKSQHISHKDISFEAFPFYELYFYLGFKHTLCNHFGFSKGLDVQSVVLNEEPYSSKPVLIFSGEYDPVTPPVWAKRFSKEHINARHIELRGSGHAQLRGKKCNWDFLNDFVRESVPNAVIQCEASLLWQ
ncbi:MAG: alpha/beta hydrolase [Agarilytica sp.]